MSPPGPKAATLATAAERLYLPEAAIRGDVTIGSVGWKGGIPDLPGR